MTTSRRVEHSSAIRTRIRSSSSCGCVVVCQDQFDNLEKSTGWGIDFLERYTKFVKERADIELSYAKQIR